MSSSALQANTFKKHPYGTQSVIGTIDHLKNPSITEIKKYFDNMAGKERMVLTTEKDAMRLEGFREFFDKNGIQIDILPIRVEFLFDEGRLFDEWIKQFLLNFKL